MTGKSDEIKGRVKEAAGAIADNDRLRREGQIDQAAGKLKQAAEKAVEKVQGAVKDANKRRTQLGARRAAVMRQAFDQARNHPAPCCRAAATANSSTRSFSG